MFHSTFFKNWHSFSIRMLTYLNFSFFGDTFSDIARNQIHSKFWSVRTFLKGMNFLAGNFCNMPTWHINFYFIIFCSILDKILIFIFDKEMGSHSIPMFCFLNLWTSVIARFYFYTSIFFLFRIFVCNFKFYYVFH